MKKCSRILALLLCVLFVVQPLNLPILAQALQPNYIRFADAPLPANASDGHFYFGSMNMTVSENSTDTYLMRIVRTGACEDAASVDVKFTDISAVYGVNYTVGVLDERIEPVTDENATSITDFFLANADGKEELTPVSEAELFGSIVENGGFDTADANGNVISSVTVSEESANETAPEGMLLEGVEGSTEMPAVVTGVSSPLDITAADNALISDLFPGTTLTVPFAAGETEKFITVRAKYDAAAEGDCLAAVTLRNPSEGYAVTEDSFTTDLTITDEDDTPSAVVAFDADAYTADGESVSVTVTRVGALNEIAAVNLCSVEGTAETGYDFAGIDATVYFPMGIKNRTVEIPVRHTDPDNTLTFTLKLVDPVNCFTDLDEAVVSITPGEDAEDASLLGTNADYDAYLGNKILPNEYQCFGNAWNTDSSWFKYSCKGVDYDTWNGGTYHFSNPYVYDGIRINWDAFHNGWGSISYTYINTDNGHVYYSDDNEWSVKTDDVIFDKIYNYELWIGSLTSYFNGIQVNVRSVRPILRTFAFTLVDADPLPLAGVDDITAKSYAAVEFAGCLDSVKTVNAVPGGSFTVSMPRTQASFLELHALEFLDKDGNTLYTLMNKGDTNSIEVKLTDELMEYVACGSIDYSHQSDGRYIGEVSIKPWFTYRDAKVTVKPSSFGTFDGDLTLEGSTEKTITCHIGDRIDINGIVASQYEGAYVPNGVQYEKRDSEGKLLPGGSGQYYYEGEPVSYLIDSPKVVLTPTFRANDNAVRIRVLKADVSAGVFDRTSGFFSFGITPETVGEYYVYTVSADNVHLDQLVTVSAVPAAANKVCVWSVPGKEYPYSGNTLYYSAARDAENNLITLSTADAAKYDMSGWLYNADKNLAAGGVSVMPVIPAEGAVISAGDVFDNADTEGAFYLSDVRGAAKTAVRLLICNNNVYTFKEVYLGASGGDCQLGVISTAVNTLDGAYFTGIYAEQDGRPVLATDTLRLDGKKLALYASYKDGTKYVMNGTEMTEHVTGVTFYVLDGTTHAVKSVFAGEKVSDGVYGMGISRFTPDEPDKFCYGDVFYVSMTTDRVSASGLDESGSVPEQFASTKYTMLSTGFAIIKDDSYKPQMINFTLPVSADDLLGEDENGADLSEEDPDKPKKHKRYVAFPFIGNIDSVVGVKGILRNVVNNNLGGDSTMPDYDDWEEDDDDGGTHVDPENVTDALHTQLRITVSFEKLPYGGTRFKFGVTATMGNKAWQNSAKYNPWESYKLKSGAGEAVGRQGRQMIDHEYNQYGADGSDFTKAFKNAINASLGTPRMTFSVSLGIYVDFGVIQTVDDETGEGTNLFHDEFVFLGIGGYLGGSGSVEWQWMHVAPWPGYAGVTGTVGAVGYIGGTRDPDAMLKYEDMEEDDGTVNVNKLHFNFDLQVNASVKGYYGVGLPDLIGARIILGLNASFAYSPFITDYYKQLDDSWGLGANLTVGGQIDLIVTSIPVEAFSWPFFSAGFTEYYLTVSRANKFIMKVEEAIPEMAGRGFTDGYIKLVQEAVDALRDDIDNDATLEQLEKDFDTLAFYVHTREQVISDAEYNTIFLDTPYEALLSADEGTKSVPILHTDSKWVAGSDAALSGAYEEDATETLVYDSYSHPTAKMISLGSGRMLYVFLLDKSSAGEVTRPTLVWSVYDDNTKTWTEPEVLRDGGTVDYTPNLCDVGDRVLISWSSSGKPFDEYENDAGLMRGMDIYAQFFDKASAKPEGGIIRLTDDTYMDAKPSVIYDDESGDIAVFYIKNAAESAEITDFIASESVVCYRLYDAETKTFVTDYYESEYPNYTADQRKVLAEQYGGQRFFASSVGEDLPIGDIAVCRGYNGLGMLAYTIDLDGNTDTTNDTELYVRVYDFRSHSVYTPIRITNDNVSQALPQLIRCDIPYTDYFKNDDGEKVDGTTYLFWLENDTVVRYISLTDLIRNGVDENGAIKDTYKFAPYTIDAAIEEDHQGSVSTYQALTDKQGNLYILWLQSVIDDPEAPIETPAAREIFAAAQIRPYNHVDAYDADLDIGGVIGGAWSAPFRLTYSGMLNDGICGAVTDNGVLHLLHNCCEVTYIGDTEEFLAENALTADGCRTGNPYRIGRTDLMLTTFKPVGTVEVTNFALSDEYPEAGDTVTVTATVRNTGLTTADGFTLVFDSEDNNGNTVQHITTVTDNEPLTVKTTCEVTFDWTVPASFDGIRLVCYATEKGYDNETFSHSEPIREKPHYSLTLNGIRQKGRIFSVNITVRNDGNGDAEPGDTLQISFAGLYGDPVTVYGLESPVLFELPIDYLTKDAFAEFEIPVEIPESAFDICGFDQIVCAVCNGDEKIISDSVSDFIVLTEPMNASFGDTDALELNKGSQKQLSVDVGSGFLSALSDIRFSSDDTSVAAVSADGTVKAVGEGETTVKALILPFGTELSMPVSVKDTDGTRSVTAHDTRSGSTSGGGTADIGGDTGDTDEDNPETAGDGDGDTDTEGEQTETASILFDDVHDDDYFYTPVYWAVENKITVGVSDTLFAPDDIITNAEIVTFLWRAAGCPEADVKDAGEETWYTKAVAWAIENGITADIGDVFDPKAIPTRAEAVTMLYRASGDKAPTIANRFEDVHPDDFFYDAVVWADETDVTYGTSDTTFTPDGECTRAEIVTFLYRMFADK